MKAKPGAANPVARLRIATYTSAPATAMVGGCRTKGCVRTVQDDSRMPQNFIECDREQSFLLPPDVREWLPEGHLAWFILDTVEELDLAPFYAAYRADGHGRAAYEPSMVVAVILYAY